MKKISAVIIAKNEESNLPRCLDSIKWVDEIIVVDSGSTDSTEAIAQKAGAKVFNIEWKGFGQAKRFGVSQSSCDWVLSLDADEEIPPTLAEEIKSNLASGTMFDGFMIPRRTLFLGRWIKHCGWYPDYVLRLFDKTKGEFDGAVVH
jgi:glycosyltransferase involved in cell wall biosynthesis